MPELTILATALGVGLLLILILWLSIRIVNRGDKLVVYRLGNTDESLVKGPGLVLLIPFIDRPQKVNLREQYVEVPSQTAITKDNVTIPIDFLIYWRIVDPLKSVVNVQDFVGALAGVATTNLREQYVEVPSQTAITKDNVTIPIDFLIYWRIVDPLKSVVNVQDFVGALAGVATTNLRAVVGDFLLDDVLSKRDSINEVLRVKLDEITENWGGKITRVEIREITPPRDILESMNRMLSAERTRRAVITESEGARQSAINVAEGQKQSEILKAEGERQAAILRAEGFSEALTRIFNAATGVDQKTMTLQYLEALKQIGASPSTKYVIPIEFTRLLEPIREYIAPTEESPQIDAPRSEPPASSAG